MGWSSFAAPPGRGAGTAIVVLLWPYLHSTVVKMAHAAANASIFVQRFIISRQYSHKHFCMQTIDVGVQDMFIVLTCIHTKALTRN